MSRNFKKSKAEIIVVKKFFCPICGSAAIRSTAGRRFRCLNCKAIFSVPKKAELEVRKKPRYIG